MVYTDKEENAATNNFLKNHSAAREDEFREMVSKAKKKKEYLFIIPG
jgi:hypothetical protein